MQQRLVRDVRKAAPLLVPFAIVALVFLLTGCEPAPTGCTADWVGPTEGDWSTPANWRSGAVPGPADTACAPAGSSPAVHTSVRVAGVRLAGTVTIGPGADLAIGAGASTIHQLELAGGQISGDVDLTIEGGHAGSGALVTTKAIKLSGSLGLTGDVTGDVELIGGELTGPGRLLGAVQGEGRIRPGSATARTTLTVDGSLTLETTSVVEVTVGAGTVASDRVEVGGAASMQAAALTVHFDATSAPPAGQRTVVLHAGGGLAQPLGTTVADPLPGKGTVIEQGANDVAVTVTDCDPATLHPGAELGGADLSSDHLYRCDLRSSVLVGANLRGADLSHANLYRADLRGADLTGVTWDNTTCPDGSNSNEHGNTCEAHLMLVLTVDHVLAPNDAVGPGADLVDTAIGDGACTTTAGDCSLRAAIQEANVHPGPDVLVLLPGTHGVTIAGANEDAAATGDLDITDELEIHGTTTGDQGARIVSTVADSAIEVRGSSNLTMRDVMVVGAFANGSAINNPAGTVTLDEVNLIGSARGLVSGGAATVRRSSFVGHAEAGVIATGGTIAMDRVTVAWSGDTAAAVDARGGSIAIVNTTISSGRSPLPQTPRGGPGIRRAAGATVSVANTIVADQRTGKANCLSTVTSLGSNLTTDATCGFTATTDLQVTTAKLGPLSTIGTPSAFAPSAGSAAIDSGSSSCGTSDEFGRPAPADGDGDGTPRCDRGAIELSTFRSLTMSVGTTADTVDAHPGDGVCETSIPGECSLRAAVQEANATNGPDTIDLQPLTYDLTIEELRAAGYDPGVATGDLDIESELTIHGHGAQLFRQSDDNLIEQLGYGVLSIDDLTMFGGTTNTLSSRFGPVHLTRVTTPNMASPVTLGSEGVVLDSDLEALSMPTGQVSRSAIRSLTSTGSVTVERSTVWGSLTAQNGAAAVITDSTLYGTDSVLRNAGGTVTAENSIIATTSTSACLTPITTTNGYNLSSDASCGLTAPTDVVNSAPLLSAFERHGGQSRNFAPLKLSPALESGRPACTPADQRGVAAPSDWDGDGASVCDRGAIESDPPVRRTFDVTQDSDESDTTPGDGICRTATGTCSLRAAWQEADAALGPDIIRLQSAHTYTLAPPIVTITDAFVLQGNGSSVQITSSWEVGGIEISGPIDPVFRDVALRSNYQYGLKPVLAAGSSSTRLENVTVEASGYGITSDGPMQVNRSVVTSRESWFGAGSSITGSRFNGAGNGGGNTHVTINGPVDTSAFVDVEVIAEAGTTLTRSTVSNRDRYVSTTLHVSGNTTVTDSTISRLGTLEYGLPTLRVDAGATATVTNSIIDPNWGASACSGTVVSGGHNLVSDTSCGLTAPTDLQGLDPHLGPLGPEADASAVMVPATGSPAIDTGRAGCLPNDQRGRPAPQDGDGDGVQRCDRGSAEVPTWNPLTLTVNATSDRLDVNPGDGVCQTSTPGECTLRAAIQETNASAGPDVVHLATNATYQISLPTPSGLPYSTYDEANLGDDLDVSNELVLEGHGATINHGNVGGFDLTGGRLTVRDVVFSHDGNSRMSLKVQNGDLLATNVRMNTGAGLSSVSASDGTLTIDHADLRAVDIYARSTVVISNSSLTPTFWSGAPTVRSSTLTDPSVRSSGVTVTDSTIVKSTSVSLFPASSGSAPTLHNTAMIARNTVNPLCASAVTSAGYNAASDASCGLNGVGDRPAVAMNVRARVIAGVTSYEPMTGSGLLDAGAPDCAATDQLGATRTDSDGDGVARCEIGAVEAGMYRDLDLVVTTPTDETDLVPGDGLCITASGQCSLRAAIQESNVGTGPRDMTLTASQTYTLSIGGASTENESINGDLDLATSLAIHGNGATITRTTSGDAFEVIAGSAVADHLVLSSAPGTVASGAALTLSDTTLAASPIFASGSLSIVGATISASTITATGTTTITQSSIAGTGCLAAYGTGASLTVRQSLIRACQGAMVAASSAQLVFENSTITESGSATASAIIANGSARVHIHSSTLTQNVGTPFSVGTNPYPNGLATVTVTSSIVALQQGGVSDCASPITSGGSNLFSSATCSGAVASDLLGTDPQLEAIADNGGPTLTYMPAVTSPAVDSGNASVCLALDQRGAVRPRGVACDRGSVER
jgi:CSLREA domain-containing protein